MSVLRPTGLATAAVRSRPSALVGALAAFVLVATVVTGSVSMTVSASSASSALSSSSALSGADPAVRDQLAELCELSDMGIGFCVMTVYLAVFVVSQVMALAVAQRRHESALLRTIGAEPKQLRRMVSVEALGTALAALPIGYGLGALLGRFWLHGTATHGMAPVGISFHVGWPPLVAAGAVLLVCSQLGGLIAGWRASRTRPSAALAESSVQGGERVGAVRGMVSLAALAGAVVLTGIAVTGSVENASQMIPLVLLCHLAAIGLAGPWIGRCVIALCARSRWAFGGAAGDVAGVRQVVAFGHRGQHLVQRARHSISQGPAGGCTLR